MRAKPSVMADHRMAEEMYNLSEVEILFGEDAFSTELFKPNGMKEKENIESWQITAYRRFAKLGRKHCARIIKRIPSGLQPVATMQGSRCTTSPRLIFCGWRRVSTGRFMPLA